MPDLLSTPAVAERLGIEVWRLDYLERFHLRPPVARVGKRRVWTEGDVERVRVLHGQVPVVPGRGRRK